MNVRISELADLVASFATERGWSVFHDPKNLAMAIASEAGELCSCLRSEDRALRRWRRRGEALQVSAIAWAESLCGHVSLQAAEVTAQMLGEPVAFGALDATLAAQLFNATGRRRGSLQDCMIAAVAIRSGATLATNNVTDFRRSPDTA